MDSYMEIVKPPAKPACRYKYITLRAYDKTVKMVTEMHEYYGITKSELIRQLLGIHYKKLVKKGFLKEF
jgi:hypothetical protein